MPGEQRSTGAATPVLDGPQWRALLEARWQARLEELTELSLAYHAAAEGVLDGRAAEPGQREAQVLLRRAVAVRRRLADVEEALGRLAVGRYGRCEQCGSPVPHGLLALIPETRYCPRCDAGPGRAVATRPVRR
jgi:RNA polymerase-binding transcription factor DksA